MLVLTRKRNESIVIFVGAETIVLTIENVQGERAKIGIEAPRHFQIMRGELLERMANNGKTN